MRTYIFTQIHMYEYGMVHTQLVCMFLHVVNPAQIFCKYYLYLIENVQPIQVAKMLYYTNLFSEYDLDVVLNIPIDHMKSIYIIEHFRHMGAPGIFTFLDILHKIGNQKQISDILRKGM